MMPAGDPADLWCGRSPATWRLLWGVPTVLVFRATSSTNDVAMRLADAGAAAGTTVIAETQTAGRGQHGRSWAGSAGQSLLLSVVLRPGNHAVDPSTMPVRIGTAVASAIEQETGVQAWLKWPNDVVVPGHGKIGGILCEGATGAGAPWLVAGIGINVDQSAADLAAVGGLATSLRLCGASADRARLAAAVLRALSPFRVLPPPIDAQLLDRIASRDALLGKPVSVNGRAAGFAAGIDEAGRLLLRSDAGLDRLVTGTVRPLLEGQTNVHDANTDDAVHGLRIQSEAPQ